MKCKDRYKDNIYFYDDDAYIDKVKTTKEETFKYIKELRISEENSKIKKRVIEGGTIIYTLKSSISKKEIHFSSRYLDSNKEYIDILDKWEKEDKTKDLKQLRSILIACAVSAGTATILHEPATKVLEKMKDGLEVLLTDEVGNLEREIAIHSGHGIAPNGEEISPYLGHSCVLGSDKSISVEDRIVNYCEKYDLEYMQEAAIEKYDLYYYDNVEEGKKIDLREIEKEHKKLQKSKKN